MLLLYCLLISILSLINAEEFIPFEIGTSQNFSLTAITIDTFKGNNNGTKYELKYKLSKKAILYVVILSQFVTKDNDNHIELYGVQNANSKNYIFYIIISFITVIVLIIVGLLVMKCIKNKKKNEIVYPINETLDNVQLLPARGNN